MTAGSTAMLSIVDEFHPRMLAIRIARGLKAVDVIDGRNWTGQRRGPSVATCYEFATPEPGLAIESDHTMTIAATAVSGQLEKEIARKLVAMRGGVPIIGLARTSEKAQGHGIEIRRSDCAQPDQLKASLEGVGALLLVSGIDAPDGRIQQHRNVIEAARFAGVGKIVYTSIQGPEEGRGFSPVVQSNRQTEADIRASGLTWAIGRNGIYVEPDIEYIDSYRKRGEIANSPCNGNAAIQPARNSPPPMRAC